MGLVFSFFLAALITASNTFCFCSAGQDFPFMASITASACTSAIRWASSFFPSSDLGK